VDEPPVKRLTPDTARQTIRDFLWRCRMPPLSIALAAAALAVAAGPSAAHDPAAHRAEPAQYQLHDPANCFCRAQGKTFAVGETACLRTGEGPRVAECGMVLNNTSWQFTARPCPES
jgi:Flp pilus assembly protein TadG